MMCKLAVGRLISTLAQAQSQLEAEARNCATANCNWAGCGCVAVADCVCGVCAACSCCKLPALLPGAGQMRLVMPSIQSQLQSKLLQLLNKISEFILGR